MTLDELIDVLNKLKTEQGATGDETVYSTEDNYGYSAAPVAQVALTAKGPRAVVMRCH